MYMQDGKPIVPPMGRRAPTVNKIEFNELVERLEIAESKIAKLEAESHKPVEAEKPRAGRPPKGANE
jgi:hypothetical protein